MTNHNQGTPGQWYIEERSDGSYIFVPHEGAAAGDALVAALISGLLDNKANARRICAAVNACIGMSTETLETAAIGPNVAEWFRDWSALPAEAHELGVKEWADTLSARALKLEGVLKNLIREYGEDHPLKVWAEARKALAEGVGGE